MKLKTIFFFTMLIVFSNFQTQTSVNISGDIPPAYDIRKSIVGDIELANAAIDGAGTIGAPYVISVEYSDSTEDVTLYVAGTTEYFVLEKCNFTRENIGIYLEDIDSDTVTIRDCKFIDCDTPIYTDAVDGILVEENSFMGSIMNTMFFNLSSYLTIQNNLFEDNANLYIQLSYYLTISGNFFGNTSVYLIDVRYVNIIDNHIESIDDWFLITSILLVCYDLNIENNDFINGRGLMVGLVDVGIIKDNEFIGVDKYGFGLGAVPAIFISGCNNISINNNLFLGNMGYAIDLSDYYYDPSSTWGHPWYAIVGLKTYPTNCLIYGNNFTDNIIQGISEGYTAQCAYFGHTLEGEENMWYNEEQHIGNYWFDYDYSEVYYQIDGRSEAKDLYPTGPPIETPTDSTSIQISTVIVSILTLVSLMCLSSIYHRK
ncbi:MAG: hypothetical protein GPJ51_15800 [Candidatus Heimdallarchaeota archaeon]|nr:hypothetical protein [Candidatus Heimdallarchaeota archaeon]